MLGIGNRGDDILVRGHKAAFLSQLKVKSPLPFRLRRHHFRGSMALDALAAAYAGTGKFDIAVLTAQKGLELAEQQGPKEELALGIKKRLELYMTGQPYRQNLNNKNES